MVDSLKPTNSMISFTFFAFKIMVEYCSFHRCERFNTQKELLVIVRVNLVFAGICQTSDLLLRLTMLTAHLVERGLHLCLLTFHLRKHSFVLTVLLCKESEKVVYFGNSDGVKSVLLVLICVILFRIGVMYFLLNHKQAQIATAAIMKKMATFLNCPSRTILSYCCLGNIIAMVMVFPSISTSFDLPMYSYSLH